MKLHFSPRRFGVCCIIAAAISGVYLLLCGKGYDSKALLAIDGISVGGIALALAGLIFVVLNYGVFDSTIYSFRHTHQVLSESKQGTDMETERPSRNSIPGSYAEYRLRERPLQAWLEPLLAGVLFLISASICLIAS